MKRSMRVLIAYDGAPYADAALADLTWAGLTRTPFSSVLAGWAAQMKYPA